MSDTFRIAINQGPIFGTLSYNVNTKEVVIDFPKEDIKKQAELYFTQTHTIRKPVDLREFIDVEVVPTRSLEEFKLSLLDLYNQTSLRVDWSVTGDDVDLYK